MSFPACFAFEVESPGSCPIYQDCNTLCPGICDTNQGKRRPAPCTDYCVEWRGNNCSQYYNSEFTRTTERSSTTEITTISYHNDSSWHEESSSDFVASGSNNVLVGLLCFSALIILGCLWCAIGCRMRQHLTNHSNDNDNFWRRIATCCFWSFLNGRNGRSPWQNLLAFLRNGVGRIVRRNNGLAGEQRGGSEGGGGGGGRGNDGRSPHHDVHVLYQGHNSSVVQFHRGSGATELVKPPTGLLNTAALTAAGSQPRSAPSHESSTAGPHLQTNDQQGRQDEVERLEKIRVAEDKLGAWQQRIDKGVEALNNLQHNLREQSKQLELAKKDLDKKLKAANEYFLKQLDALEKEQRAFEQRRQQQLDELREQEQQRDENNRVAVELASKHECLERLEKQVKRQLLMHDQAQQAWEEQVRAENLVMAEERRALSNLKMTVQQQHNELQQEQQRLRHDGADPDLESPDDRDLRLAREEETRKLQETLRQQQEEMERVRQEKIDQLEQQLKQVRDREQGEQQVRQRAQEEVNVLKRKVLELERQLMEQQEEEDRRQCRENEQRRKLDCQNLITMFDQPRHTRMMQAESGVGMVSPASDVAYRTTTDVSFIDMTGIGGEEIAKESDQGDLLAAFDPLLAEPVDGCPSPLPASSSKTPSLQTPPPASEDDPERRVKEWLDNSLPSTRLDLDWNYSSRESPLRSRSSSLQEQVADDEDHQSPRTLFNESGNADPRLINLTTGGNNESFHLTPLPAARDSDDSDVTVAGGVVERREDICQEQSWQSIGATASTLNPPPPLPATGAVQQSSISPPFYGFVTPAELAADGAHVRAAGEPAAFNEAWDSSPSSQAVGSHHPPGRQSTTHESNTTSDVSSEQPLAQSAPARSPAARGLFNVFQRFRGASNDPGTNGQTDAACDVESRPAPHPGKATRVGRHSKPPSRLGYEDEEDEASKKKTKKPQKRGARKK